MEDGIELRLVGRSREVVPPVVERELTGADLAALSLPRPTAKPAASTRQLRDSHHAIARLYAEGRKGVEISAITGYTQPWLSTLQNDPAFQELIEFYRANLQFQYNDYIERMAACRNDTLQEMHMRLHDDENGKIELADLHKQFALLSDRTGFGPQSRSVNVHVHTGFAERLEEARQRAAGRALIEGPKDPPEAAE